MTIDSWYEGYLEEGQLASILTYSNGSIIDPATGLPIPGVPVYTWAAANDSAAMLANAGTPILISDIASTVSQSYSLWIVNAAGTAITPLCTPIYTLATIPVAAAGNTNWKIFCSDYGQFGAELRSTGAIWRTVGGNNLIYKRTSSLVLVEPNSVSATGVAVGPGGGTSIAFSGAHGLTTAVCVTAGDSYLNVESGTGWAVGLVKILSIPDTTHIEVAGTYANTPVISVLNTEVTTDSITLPPLLPTSTVSVEGNVSATNSAGTKTLGLKLGATSLNTLSYPNAAWDRMAIGFFNANSASIQKALTPPSSSNDYAVSTSSPNTAAIDTSAGTAVLTVTVKPAAANERLGVERLSVFVSS